MSSYILIKCGEAAERIHNQMKNIAKKLEQLDTKLSYQRRAEIQEFENKNWLIKWLMGEPDNYKSRNTARDIHYLKLDYAKLHEMYEKVNNQEKDVELMWNLEEYYE